ncbi:Sigma-70 region 2 [Paenibacillus algorifonticola]|uniref:Sigma-70 region 2 n=1 Tax=Paenibacillus algorifonticola TaxID=684063 RepID=A0A1I2D6J3_9BACL|nr:hypothetical protein [Paenibacillus algorifonticola]SFE76142.1 Sigma-70 region 2 [Paenibacillus algorifonticola]
MKDQDIHSWLTRMIQVDSEAFRYVYEATSDHVFRTLHLFLNNQEDADDVINEVYMQLFKSLPSSNNAAVPSLAEWPINEAGEQLAAQAMAKANPSGSVQRMKIAA